MKENRRVDFERLFDAAPGNMMAVAADGPFTILAATDGYLAAVNKTRADIVGKGLFEVYPHRPGDPATEAVGASAASFQRVIDTRAPDVMEISRYDIAPPGSDDGGYETRFWEVVNTPVFGEGGRVIAVINKAEDVTNRVVSEQNEREQAGTNEELENARRAAVNLTEDAVEARREAEKTSSSLRREVNERKLAETALRQSETRYRELFASMTEAFALHEIILDEKGNPIDYRFLEANPAFEAMTGLKPSEIIGKTVSQVLPGTESYWVETYGKVALTGVPLTFTNRSEPLGKWYEVFSYAPRHGFFATVFTDVSLRKKAEEDLERYGLLDQNSRDIILFVDLAKGCIIEANAAAEKAYGYTREELHGKQIQDLRTPEEQGLVPAQMSAAGEGASSSKPFTAAGTEPTSPSR